jgi:hypothetical protein
MTFLAIQSRPTNKVDVDRTLTYMRTGCSQEYQASLPTAKTGIVSYDETRSNRIFREPVGG